MSTPIEIVRAQHAWMNREALGDQAPFTGAQYQAALASALRDAERFKALERAHNDPDSNHAWLDADLVGKGGFTLAELADRLREGAT